jgi:hypothetical protein
LDKVILENGPVFGRIDLGCEITCQSGVCSNGQSTQICTGAQNGANGCNNWNVSTQYPLEYLNGDQNSVNQWTGNPSPSCGNNMTATGTGQNLAWQQMSIVYTPTSGQLPSYNYPLTGMSAWLCETSDVGLNNSGAQGEEYYFNFTAQSQAGGFLSVNGSTAVKAAPRMWKTGPS